MRSGAVVAAVVVLAGCAGVFGPATPSSSGTTPVPVAAPGVTHDGIVDPERLAAAHEAAVRDRSHTLRITLTADGGPGQTGSTAVLRFGPDREAYSLEKTVTWAGRGGDGTDEAVTGRLRAWSDGNRTVYAITESGNTYYRRTGPDVPVLVYTLEADDVVRYVPRGMGRVRVREVERDGWIAYRIEAAGTFADGSNASLVAVVDAFGLVYEYRYTGPRSEIAWLDGNRTATITIRYDDLGSTTVGRPGWVDPALFATAGAGTTACTDDPGECLRLEQYIPGADERIFSNDAETGTRNRTGT